MNNLTNNDNAACKNIATALAVVPIKIMLLLILFAPNMYASTTLLVSSADSRMLAIQQKIATFHQDIAPVSTQNQNLDLFFEQLSIAIATADLEDDYNQYLVFYQEIIAFKQNNPDWKTNENFPSLDDPQYASLNYNLFASLHYLTYQDIDEQNIKWVIRKYTVVFAEALG